MRHFLVFFFLLSLAASPTLFGQARKYEIKSGIVTFENVMKMGPTHLKKKEMVYFDDFGLKECKETYMNHEPIEAFFTDGTDLYGVKFDQKTAFKRGKAVRGTEYRVDWTEISAGDKKEGRAKQLPKMTVAGKECETYEVTDRSGTRTVFAGWGHICLYTQINSKNMVITIKALKIEENAKVAPEKFSMPKGITLQ